MTEIQDLIQAFEIFKLDIANGAAFDSYSNQHEEECLPGTRTELLQQITDWSESPQGKCIFRLNGMAGTGKSTISRTVARSFQAKGLLGASFFFKRGEADRGTAARFFPTIVWQLIIQEARLIPSVRKAIQINPDLSKKSLREQFNKLLLQPLLDLEDAHTHASTIAVVIDALDECDREEDIQLLLRLLPQIQASSSTRVGFL